MNDYKLVPMECAIRALARHVYNDGHSAPQVTTPADRYLNQCVTAFNASYEAAAETHRELGDAKIERIQLAADQGMDDAVEEGVGAVHVKSQRHTRWSLVDAEGVGAVHVKSQRHTRWSLVDARDPARPPLEAYGTAWRRRPCTNRRS